MKTINLLISDNLLLKKFMKLPYLVTSTNPDLLITDNLDIDSDIPTIYIIKDEEPLPTSEYGYFFENITINQAVSQINLALKLIESNNKVKALINKDYNSTKQIFLLELALELTKTGYWIIDLDKSKEYYYSSDKAAKILGELPSKIGHLFNLTSEWMNRIAEVDKETAKKVYDHLNRVIAGEDNTFYATYPYKKPIDGKVIWIEEHGKVERDSKGNPMRIHGVLRDITYFKNIETKLLKAKEESETAIKIKNEFLANTSHEIRTPMTVIIGLGDLLERSDLTVKQRKYVEELNFSSKKLLRIINNILDFSNISTKKVYLENIDFSIDKQLENIRKIITPETLIKNLTFNIYKENSVPDTFYGDPNRILQVILNLCNNAIKFTEIGEVSLYVRTFKKKDSIDYLQFEIKDTGIGMKKSQLENLFNPFFQLDTSITKKYSGMGLGLAISKNLATLMNGNISVDSIYGVGSSFKLTIPFNNET